MNELEVENEKFLEKKKVVNIDQLEDNCNTIQTVPSVYEGDQSLHCQENLQNTRWIPSAQ